MPNGELLGEDPSLPSFTQWYCGWYSSNPPLRARAWRTDVTERTASVLHGTHRGRSRIHVPTSDSGWRWWVSDLSQWCGTEHAQYPLKWSLVYFHHVFILYCMQFLYFHPPDFHRVVPEYHSDKPPSFFMDSKPFTFELNGTIRQLSLGNMEDVGEM